MANSKEPQSPKEVEQTDKKRSRWWLIPAGMAIAALVIIGVFLLRREPTSPAIAATPATTEVVPATTPTTESTSTTSTTVPATTPTTESTSTTSTTIFLPIIDREDLGFLEEGDDGRLVYTYEAFLSGIVVKIESKQVTLQEGSIATIEGEEVSFEEGEAVVRNAQVLYMDLGDHLETGEAVIGILLLTAQGHSTMNGMPYCRPVAGGNKCDSALEGEVTSLLEVGRQYRFYIGMDLHCEEVPEEQQALCLQWEHDTASLYAYNNELVAALKGGKLPDTDGLGHMGSVKIPLGVGIAP